MLQFTCPVSDCDGEEWTVHGMSGIGHTVDLRELRCTECETPQPVPDRGAVEEGEA